MALQIQYTRIGGDGRRSPLGGTVLAVTTAATPGGAQPTTPNPDATLEIGLRSDVWAAVDIAASPDPTASAASILIVGPGAPQTVRGRKALKVSAIGTAAPGGGGGTGGVDLTQIRQTANDAFTIADQARQDVAAKPTYGELDAARSVPGLWIYPGNGNGGAALAPNQTNFPVPGGYPPGFVRVRIGIVDIDNFTASDGQNVVIPGRTFGANDLVRIEVLKAGLVANAASKAAVDAMQDQVGDLTRRLNALNTPDNSGWTAP